MRERELQLPVAFPSDAYWQSVRTASAPRLRRLLVRLERRLRRRAEEAQDIADSYVALGECPGVPMGIYTDRTLRQTILDLLSRH